MIERVRLPILLIAFLAVLVTAGLPLPAPSQAGADEELPTGPLVVRVFYQDPAAVAQLASYDIWEHDRDARYLVVAVDSLGYRHLQELGFRLEVDQERTQELNQVNEALPGQVSGIPGYPCYRTVEETFAAAEQIVAEHPDLATWSDVGDSWEKAEGLGGYDLMVLRLTNAAAAGPKPKFLATFSIHAREYAPAELGTRLAEYLVDNYGLDADVTWLLDYHEIHLMLHANPDGRKHAEAGQSWRKNTNDNYCPFTILPPPYGPGADLNRNFEFQWGCCGGSSTQQCEATYRGPSAASEPETQAIQAYLRAQFPDQRDDPLDSAAPADATGVYLDVHSYGDLVLWPWGFTSDAPPNGTALQTLGRKLAYFNGYEPDQAIGLYPTDGATDDFAYGDLGVAAYTFELGTAFFEQCSYFEDTILPDNLPALVHAAKVARFPYLTPAGPDAVDVAVTPDSPAVLTATIDDTRYNNQNGAEPVQNIVAAEYYVDVPPWDTASGPVAMPMAAVDGAFDSQSEAVTAAIDTAGLSPGQHITFVRGQDADGNWGVVSAAFLEVSPCAAPDQVTGLAISTPDASTVRLDWDASAGATSYEVWRATDDPYFDPTTLDCANPAPYTCGETASTFYQAPDLGDVNQNFTYRVVAASSCGHSTPTAPMGEFDFSLAPGTP